MTQDRATDQAAMAGFAEPDRRHPEIGPWIGPPWPDSISGGGRP